MLREGTIVDATLIAASPSTKNRAKVERPFHVVKNRLNHRREAPGD